MQLSGDADLAAAVEAANQYLVWRLEVDWNRDGLYSHAFSDLTSIVKSIRTDRDVQSSLPAETTLIEGYLAGQMQVTLGGTRPQDSQPIARLLSPWNSGGSLFGEGRLGIPIRAFIGNRTATGSTPSPQQFQGFISDFSVDSRTGDVILICLDPADDTRAAIDLPLWAVEQGSLTTPTDDWRINSQWVIDYVFRRNGVYMSPPPMPGCVFLATCHGSLVPEVGHNGFLDGFTSVGLTTPDDQVYYPGRAGWGLAYGGQPGKIPATYARTEISSFSFAAGKSITFQAQIDMRHVASVQGAGAWCMVGSDDFVIGGSGSGHRIRNRIDTTGKQWCDIYNPGPGSGTLLVSLGGPTYPLTGFADVWVRLDFGNPLSNSFVTFPGTGPIAINLSGLTSGSTWTHLPVIFAPPYPMHDLQVCDATGRAAGATIYDAAGWVPQVDLDTGLNDLTGLPLRRGVGSWDLLKEVVGAEFGIVGFSETGRPFFKNRDTVRRQNLTVEKTLTEDKLITDLRVSEKAGSVRNRVTAAVTPRRITVWSGTNAWDVVFRLKDISSLVCPAGTSFHRIKLDMPAWMQDQSDAVFYTAPENWPPADNLIQNAGRFCAVREKDMGTAQTGVVVSIVTLPPSQFGPDMVQLNVFNPGLFPIVFADTDGSPALWLVGRAYNDEDGGDFSLSFASSVARYGERVLQLPQSDWHQRPESVRTIARQLLKDLRNPMPQFDSVVTVGDCRLQLEDTASVQDAGVLGGPVWTTVNGISRSLTVDSNTGAAKLEDTLNVRPFATPGKWILGHPQWSVLGQTTRV